MAKIALPIDPLLPQIVGYIQRNTISILQAEPGAGKTTRIPPALLEIFAGQIIVLEPRRLAARLAARRVADELGERIGGTVGYQVRFDQIGSAETRLWYVTEGILTQKLLSDRRPRGLSVIVLDEFHERHLETDLAFALLRDLQHKQPELRIVLMSATLETDQLADQLNGAAVIKAPGRTFPVDIRHKPHSSAPLEEQVASAVNEAVSATTGHVLVFLPGAAEIRRAIQACEPIARRAGAKLLPLHGDLSGEAQDDAVAPSTARKIICATNVAESSITIDGVDAVIDSGLARVLTHSAWSGLSSLTVQKISQSSAIQRAGRAGRTSSGIAIRLYSGSDFVRRPKDMPPEILRSDLAPTCLQLAAAGIDWNDLPWLDAPSPDLIARAQELLQRLDALDSQMHITAQGRAMHRLSVPPRLARFVVEAASMGERQAACDVAARLAEGRFRLDAERNARFDSDIAQILATELNFTSRKVRDQLLHTTASMHAVTQDDHALEKSLLLAYSDRVARRRGDTLLLSEGASAKLHSASLARDEFLVAIELQDRSEQGAALVRIASNIEPDWLLEYFPGRVAATEEMVWNRESERVDQLNILRYERLTIDETRSSPRDPELAADLLASKAVEAGIGRFVDADELNRFLRRIHFAKQHSPNIDLPADILQSSLRQLATGLTSFSQLREVARDGGLQSVIEANLPMRSINEIAPTHVVLPNGRRARIEYHDDRPPSVASRLQDFFGMTESPSVARGAVPLTVHLLAPNHRPVQVTTDLVSFWKNLYPQLRRELGRRYPKHAWPENPALTLRDK